MTSTGAVNRTRDLRRHKFVAELGDWAASVIAWAAVFVMYLTVIWILLYTTDD